MKRIALVLFALGAFLRTPSVGAQEHVFKIATLAPEGSSWMLLFHQWGKAVEEHSGG